MITVYYYFIVHIVQPRKLTLWGCIRTTFGQATKRNPTLPGPNIQQGLSSPPGTAAADAAVAAGAGVAANAGVAADAAAAAAGAGASAGGGKVQSVSRHGHPYSHLHSQAPRWGTARWCCD